MKLREKVEKNLIYPLEYLDYPKYELTETELEKVSHGNPIVPLESIEEGIVVLVRNEKIIAVAKLQNGTIKCEKVFI